MADDPRAAGRRLPIWGRRDALLAALDAHRVAVVVSPTGTGKTTQVPQMLWEAGLAGSDRVIGVTQPRRIAATSVAARVAAEQGCALGGAVGYRIRFDDATGPETRLKFMTDGILLMETHADPDLSSYGVIVVDEAHERTLNVDFTLGLLQRLLAGPRADDLRVVVMSATIRPQVFSDFFGGAPIVRAEAAMHPVEVRYRPLVDPRARDEPSPPPARRGWRGGRRGRDGDARARLPDAVASIVGGLEDDGVAGDVLIFLPGQAEIRACVDKLRATCGDDAVVLPLFARLSDEEQQRAFEDTAPRRKIICATNIAETSLTIDGIRVVIDGGTVKIHEYRAALGVPRLIEVPCPKASLDQRKGRAGRTAPGLCVRLFDASELGRRPDFAAPEIVRSDLSEVVLRLKGLGVDDVGGFPFPTPPARRDLRAAFELLEGIDAIDRRGRITRIGRALLRFPLSPRIGRVILEAADHRPATVDDVLVVCAFLSAPKPYPVFDDREAERVHRARLADRFGYRGGDAVMDVRVFRGFQQADDPSAFADHWSLDLAALQEIANIHEQLADIARDAGIEVRKGSGWDDLIRCMAHAWPPFVLRRTGQRHYGSRTLRKVFIHPTSTLFGEEPEYILASEIMETSRVYARGVSVLTKEARKGLDLDRICGDAGWDGPPLPRSEGRARRKKDWWQRVGRHKHGKGRKGKRRR